MKESVGDHIFNIINTILMIVICLVILYPLWYVIVASFTDPKITNSGAFLLIPQGFYTPGYEEAFDYPLLWSGYWNNIVYTVVGVIVSLVATIPCAYALSRYDMVGRRPLMFLFTFTMFFNGGMIPNYMLIRNLKLLDTYWALILPGAISAYNLILMRNFVAAIPPSLEEAAYIDGANELQILWKVIVPLCKPALATFTLFHAVGHWNGYFNATMYINSRDKWPLMLIVREMVAESGTSMVHQSATAIEDLAQPFTLQMAIIIFTITLSCAYILSCRSIS